MTSTSSEANEDDKVVAIIIAFDGKTRILNHQFTTKILLNPIICTDASRDISCGGNGFNTPFIKLISLTDARGVSEEK